MGSREKDLKRSFKVALHLLLTTFSKQDFCNAFPKFTQAEKEHMHRLYIQVFWSCLEAVWKPFCRSFMVGVGTFLQLLKTMGNEDYKNGHFAEALSLYDAAISLDPEKASYIYGAVTVEEGMALAKEHGCLFYECSANVQQCFKDLTLKILDKPGLLEQGSVVVKRQILKEKQLSQEKRSDNCCS